MPGFFRDLKGPNMCTERANPNTPFALHFARFAVLFHLVIIIQFQVSAASQEEDSLDPYERLRNVPSQNVSADAKPVKTDSEKTVTFPDTNVMHRGPLSLSSVSSAGSIAPSNLPRSPKSILKTKKHPQISVATDSAWGSEEKPAQPRRRSSFATRKSSDAIASFESDIAIDEEDAKKPHSLASELL